jgi:acetyl-CoA carboxylase biotin carboxyl carrier protein
MPNKGYKMSFHATVESMSKTMDEMGITELELERNYLFGIYRKHIKLSKQQTTVVSHQSPVVMQATKPDCRPTADDSRASANALRSPMVGVAYLAPEPGAEPFVTVGASVKAGDTVALIEAMKTFNPIKADRDGVVREILVAEGQAVEFDQPLIVIE